MKTETFCQWIMDTARKQGASDCKVDFTRNRQVTIEYRRGKPEFVKEATTRSIWLTIYKNGRCTVQQTSDLRKDALTTFISVCLNNAKHLSPDPFRTLPSTSYIEDQKEIDLKLFDPSMAKLSIESRHDLVRAVEQACLARGTDRTISAIAGAEFSEMETMLTATNGFSGSNKATTIWLWATMTAKDRGNRNPSGYFRIGCRHLKDLPTAAFIGRQAADRTIAKIGAKKLVTQTVPILVENLAVQRLLKSFVSGMQGAGIQQERSFLVGKKGMVIADPAFSVINNPLLEKGLESRLYDRDGLPSKILSLVDGGRVEAFLIDWYYSRKLGWEPTTGQTANLTIPPGRRSLAQMMAGVGRGILITDFMGGNVNPTTGDFSIGIIGQLFEKGEPVQAVAEMNIADNHLRFWKKLAAVGNDPWTFGEWRVPSLLISDVMVSGV